MKPKLHRGRKCLLQNRQDAALSSHLQHRQPVVLPGVVLPGVVLQVSIHSAPRAPSAQHRTARHRGHAVSKTNRPSALLCLVP